MKEDIIEVAECPSCGDYVDIEDLKMGDGVCLDCATQGFWIDPVGSVHMEEGDPAAAYI